MEYRRRRRTTRSTGRNPAAAAIFGILLVAAAIVYLIGASSAGTWVAKNIVAPVFRTLGIEEPETQQQQGEPQAVAALSTKAVRVPAATFYALQMGVYSNRENAEKQASSLQALGAGGYILEDGGKYRVLAACYQDAESLQSVRQRLLDEGLESTTYLMELPDTEMMVTATEEQLDTIAAAAAFLSSVNADMYTLVIGFDKEQKSAPDGAVMADQLLQRIQTLAEQTKGGMPDGNSVSKALQACLSGMIEELKPLSEYAGESTAEFTSKLKYAQLAFVRLTQDFASAAAN